MKNTKKTGGNSRQLILDVSVQLFAEYGYEGVAMRQISTAAGVTLPAIYHHFKNKQSLFNAVETELYATHAESLLTVLKSDAPAEKRLYDFIDRLMISFEQHPAYFKILHRNLVEGRPANQTFLISSLQHVYDELRQMLNECASDAGDGVIPMLIFSCIFGYEAMRPAIQAMEGYPYQNISHAEERKLLASHILTVIKSL